MTILLTPRAPAVIVAAALCAATAPAIAQSKKNDEAVERLLAHFQREREAADWPYHRLVHQSDVVVIATFESKRSTVGDFKMLGYGDEDTTSCVASKLDIVAVLKG